MIGRADGGYNGLARAPQKVSGLVSFPFLLLDARLPSTYHTHTHEQGVSWSTLVFCRPSISPIPRLPPSHPAVVEWRAMTVIELTVSLFRLFDIADGTDSDVRDSWSFSYSCAL